MSPLAIGSQGDAASFSAMQNENFAGLPWVERVSAAESGDRHTVRLYGESEDAAASALAAATQAGHTVHELRRIEGTLEDVFVHLTGRELR